MSIDFSKVTALSDRYGNIAQLDLGGRVIWSAAKNAPAVFEVAKITANTYASSTSFSNEEFILLDVYPKAAGSTVDVTYGGLTKTLTFSGTNAQSVYFGTFRGVSDDVTTPSSGTLVVEGGYRGVGISSFNSAKSTTSYCSCITSITDWGSTSYIPQYAFYNCTLLSDVTIPSSVREVGSGAFSGCSGLNAVYITNLFAWCSVAFASTSSNPLSTGAGLYLNGELVTSVTIPSSVTSIGNYAFSGYDSITSIDIPSSVTSIGTGAFGYCGSLTSIDIPSSVTSIGASAFSSCENLTSINIPDGVTKIEDRTFLGCDSLTNIVIPPNVTSIGDSAFYKCTGLTSINIPSSVTSIGAEAFYGDTSLKEVHITDINAWCNIYFYDNASNPMYYADNVYLNGSVVTNVTIPSNITTIRYTFYNFASLTSITIPSSVTSISVGAFGFCGSLSNVNIPSSVTSIGGSAFLQCKSLTSINIPSSVTSIGASAFYKCTSLTSINIPDGVTEISNYTFQGCDSLTNIVIPSSVTSIGSMAFDVSSEFNTRTVIMQSSIPPTIDENTFADVGIHHFIVPAGSGATYKAAEKWSAYADYIMEAS